MLTVSDARAAIEAAMTRFDSESVALSDAPGRVLRTAVTAERDQPPYDRVTMDGVALRHAELAAGRRTFRVAGTQYAGDPALNLQNDGECIEIMTGAVLPAGSDCIVPVERTTSADGEVEIEAGYTAEARQFVHTRGSDHRQGDALLAPGRRVTPLDIAVVASAGLAEVHVARLPVIRVISTGNELVAAGQPIAAHQVRMSNGPALVAMLERQGYADSRHVHIADDPAVMQKTIHEFLDASDVLLLSGGVSMGKADFVPEVLDELGVQRVFHRIAQRPGKPMWFGTGPAGQAVFALPGNPVSALTCCRHYVLPALLQASGGSPLEPAQVVLADDFAFAPELTCFLPVSISSDDSGRLLAAPVLTNTSGDFTALAASDGYIELPATQQRFAAGSAWPFHAWDRP